VDVGESSQIMVAWAGHLMRPIPRATTSRHPNDGSKLLVFISKKHVQVGVGFQVLLEKEIRFTGDDATNKQWWGKQRVVCVGVVETKVGVQSWVARGEYCSEEKLSCR